VHLRNRRVASDKLRFYRKKLGRTLEFVAWNPAEATALVRKDFILGPALSLRLPKAVPSPLSGLLSHTTLHQPPVLSTRYSFLRPFYGIAPACKNAEGAEPQ
jgi:hypothetical protein